jgi:hypothetical protein
MTDIAENIYLALIVYESAYRYTEPEFDKLLSSTGTDSQSGGPERQAYFT